MSPAPDRIPGGCEDCNRLAIPYMVHDEVWLAAWPTYYEDRRQRLAQFKGTDERWRAWCLLCLGCLEHRMGRRLKLSDFPKHLPVNDPIYFGFGLKSHGDN